MHTLTRLGICAATLTAAVSPAAIFSIANASAETRVALDSNIRRCDFSLVSTAPWVPKSGLGSGSANIRSSGTAAVAEVHMTVTDEPGGHFDVGLIQEPLPSSATCGPGDPATAFTGMDVDGAGNGTATVHAKLRQGTTGVWVVVERANPNSQNPAEFYTSEFVVPT
jgi:hypothetical protein